MLAIYKWKLLTWTVRCSLKVSGCVTQSYNCMETKLIFVAGVHGVGKTTFCNSLITCDPSFNHLSASRLIKNYKKDAFSPDKQVIDVDNNQDILINAYNAFNHEKDFTLLDGHFCLFDENFVPSIIPEQTFANLNIATIILLTSSTATILKRMVARDDNYLSPESISNLQDAEIETAQKTAEKLDIPLILISEEQLTLGKLRISPAI